MLEAHGSIESTIDNLSFFRGELLYPGDAGYDIHRKVVDKRFDCYPKMIARCRGTSDVLIALEFAIQKKLPLAVRSGGHGFPGLSTIDGGLVIDLQMMNDVHIDPERRIAIIRPGALVGDIVQEAALYGLGVVAGTRARVGFGGMAIFNGQGYLGPRYGNAADNILSIEVVLADGRILKASPENHSDLFWGLCGAGDSFGVVTSFEVKLYPVPEQVYMGSFILDQSSLVENLTRLQEGDQFLSDDLFWGVKAQRSAAGELSIVVGYTFLGDEEEHQTAITTLRSLLPEAEVAFQRLAYRDLYYRPGFTGQRSYVAGIQLGELKESVASHLVDVLRLSFSQAVPVGVERSLDFYPLSKGFACQATPPNAWQIRTGYSVTARVSYDDSSQDEELASWADNLIDAISDSDAAGDYNITAINHVSTWTATIVRNTYGPAIERLLELKQQYDAKNVFSRSALGMVITDSSR